MEGDPIKESGVYEFHKFRDRAKKNCLGITKGGFQPCRLRQSMEGGCGTGRRSRSTLRFLWGNYYNIQSEGKLGKGVKGEQCEKV